MEKTLTVSIAAYNVEKYLRQCLESFVCAQDVMEQLEVIVVNDGSADQTKTIAEVFVNKYPDTFVLVDKQNGGYGSTINASLKIARGAYYRTVDGDDWVKTDSFESYVRKLRNCDSDLVITKFLRVRDDTGETQEETYGLCYDETTESFDNFLKNELSGSLTMHSMTFRTKLLVEHGITITEHCYYTDTELVRKPIPFIDTVTKIDETVYMYRIGREGQSVSMKSTLKHMDQSIHVALGNAAFFQGIIGNESITEIKRQYLSKAIAHGVASHYYLLLACQKKNDIMDAERTFDQELSVRSPYLYEEVLNTRYGSIIACLRKYNFKKYGLIPFIYHMKMRIVDLHR